MGVPLGRLFGTDIRATGGFFLLLGLYFYMFGVGHTAVAGVFCIAVVFSLLVHEFGHVFAVRRQLGTESVVILWGLGGLCVHEPAHTPRQRIIISLMGPAFSALLGGLMLPVMLYADLPHPMLSDLIRFLVVINSVWLVLNLVPIRPLDGGQALEAALELKLGRGRARAAARKVSIAFGLALVALSLYLALPFVTVIAVLLVFQNLTASQ